MKHYFLITYMSEYNERIFTHIDYCSKGMAVKWFNENGHRLLALTRISKSVYKRLKK